MIGDLHETPRGWRLQPPTECINGHQLGPNRVLVGHQPCSCQGSRAGTCRVCGETFYWPQTNPLCSVLAGAAQLR